MTVTRRQLRKLIHEAAGANRIRKVAHRAHGLLKEAMEPDWDKFTEDYITCKQKASGMQSSRHQVKPRVDKHITQAKKMPYGFNKLLAYVKKRYPECMKEKGW